MAGASRRLGAEGSPGDRACTVLGVSESGCCEWRHRPASAPINVTAVPEADVGDDVLLFGAWQGQVLPPEEVAARAGTVSHELLSGVGPRVPRIYQEG